LFDGDERTGVLYNERHRPRGDEQTLLAMHAVSVRCLTEQSILFRQSLEKSGTHSKAAECGGLDRYSPQEMSSHARLATSTGILLLLPKTLAHCHLFARCIVARCTARASSLPKRMLDFFS
jgi:hypothetical protein